MGVKLSKVSTQQATTVPIVMTMTGGQTGFDVLVIYRELTNI
jgi:hypothetical protein